MKKSNLLLVLIVAFAAVMLAQESTTTSKPATGKMTKAKAAKPAEHSLTGCLSGPNAEGAYVLKRSNGSTEVGGLDELSGHVGHKVKLTGHWVASGTEIGEKPEKNEGKEKEHDFKVDKVEMVAETCAPASAKTKTKSY